MRHTELASRYAKALFELATEANKQEDYLQGLRLVQSSFADNPAVATFMNSPLVIASDKEKALSLALKSSGLEEELIKFILLLAKKGRLELLSDIVAAYQTKEDELNKLTRGTVRSAAKLSDAHKNEIQKSIEDATKKKVVLQYREDASIIGGLVAQVGSLTFDDSLSAHLLKIKEDLTRRIN